MPEASTERSLLRILVIDHDAGERASLRAALPGFAVEEVAEGRAGVEAASRSGPDLVLVDGSLPDLEGYEIAIRLRGRGVTSPIVGLTVADPVKRGMLISAGCDGTIQKPVDPGKLPDQIRAYLAGKRDRLSSVDERRYLREYAQGLVDKLEGKVKELTEANARLTEIDRFKTEFMQSVSHELSTPLTPIVGYLKILKSRKLGEVNEKQEKVIDSMIQSTERLSRVLDNLVDFANLETGRTLIRRGPVDPVLVAQSCASEQKAAAKARRVSLEVLDRTDGRWISADETKLKQAVGNLVDNAVKFSPNGGHVLIELLGAAEGVTLSVYDQGAGVPVREQERIFEPFFHAARAGEAERAPGAGLGLPVARKVVEAHGGRIWVESPPRQQPDVSQHHFSGARFAMFLPWEAVQV
jgi:signal transduction histidine kinase